MVFLPIVAIAQLALFTFLGSVLYKPSLLSLVRRNQSVNTTEQVTTNTCVASCGTCAGLTSVGGILRPPNYPRPYGGDYECTFTITVPAGKRITVYMPVLIFGQTDRLNFRDGDSYAPSVSTFFGQFAEFTTFNYTSSSNIFTVEFSAKGFGYWTINYIFQ